MPRSRCRRPRAVEAGISGGNSDNDHGDFDDGGGVSGVQNNGVGTTSSGGLVLGLDGDEEDGDGGEVDDDHDEMRSTVAADKPRPPSTILV